MAMLTRPQKYDIEDSNIALLGSDVRKGCQDAKYHITRCAQLTLIAISSRKKYASMLETTNLHGSLRDRSRAWIFGGSSSSK